MLQLAACLAPAYLAWRLVDDNRTNTLFLDDWAYVPLYEKATRGEVTWHDLFGGYLEHRPAVVRLINVALTLWSHGNVSWQCIVSFIAVLVTWLNCGWLIKRALKTWDRTWLPWSLMGWVLFSPVQWQAFLWPSCMLVNLPLLFFTSALVCLGSRRLPFWARFAGCVAGAWLATYSYTPGLALWVLLPGAVACGYGMEDAAQQRRFLLAWLFPMLAVIFSYFYGLKNEVEPVFAYGQGQGDTATHSISAVLHAPDRGIKFALTLLGAGLARGVLGPRWDVALYMGGALFLLLLMILATWVRRWRNAEVRRAAVPFLLIAGFGFMVAGMVAAGRAWASRDVGGALNNRYACYAGAFTVGIMGMYAVLGAAPLREAWMTARPWLEWIEAWTRRLSRPLAGVLCGLLAANWFYGAEVMQAWHYARLRSAVDLHFTPVLGQMQDRGHPAAQVRLAVDRAATMNRLGFFKRPQAQNTSLTEFKKRGRLDEKLARITGTDRRPTQIEITGHALLTMHGRPPDAILLTARSEESPEPQIVDVSLPDAVPVFLFLNNLKDNQFIFDDYRPRRCGQWECAIKREKMPKGRVRLEVWALNFEQYSIAEIGDGITVDN